MGPVLTRETLSHLARGVLSVALFWLALYYVDWSGVKELFLGMQAGWLAVHVGVLVLERLVFTYKWQILLVVKNTMVPLRTLLMITLIGKFWGLFLPSSVSVDIIRGYYLYKKTASGAISASSVLVDKVMSLWALLLMGLVGLLFYGSAFAEVKIGLYLGGLVAVTALGLYFLQREEFAHWIDRQLPRLIGNRVSGIFLKVYRSFIDYKKHPRTLSYSFVLSVLLQLTRVLGVYTMAMALQIDIPGIYYFVLIPIAMILIMLPISIGGFGLREGIFVGMFALAGMSTTDAFALGFALSITDLLISLVGGLLYAIERPTVMHRG
ncbi:MAG: flippase-like domain-containing protein [Gammaproteobacteria bacterium]|nr:flippase-like domain-containing protein [Gammaproteobacteria bacterium]